MPKANIHRRRTLEEIYPPDAFASDAAQNGGVPSEVLNGVRKLSAAGDLRIRAGNPADRRGGPGQLSRSASS
jgi:hypothetical protein